MDYLRLKPCFALNFGLSGSIKITCLPRRTCLMFPRFFHAFKELKNFISNPFCASIINGFLQKSNNILYFVVVIGAVENVEKSFLTKFSTIFWRFFGNFGKNVEKYHLWKTC